MSLLVVEGLAVKYGGMLALDSVSMRVHEGEIVGLIGPNGAGKTTFIDALAGFVPTHHGRIEFAGRDITRAAPHRRSAAGLVRTFQSLELFDDLSVLDNLAVAARAPSWRSTLTDALWPKSHDTTETHRVMELLGLSSVADRLPPELSNGQRHVVAVARALVSGPKLLVLDEPAAGLDPAETEGLAATLRRVRDDGVSILVVEHDMSLVFGVCDTVHVLDLGTLIAGGPPDEVRNDAGVIAAYLGSPTDAPGTHVVSEVNPT